MCGAIPSSRNGNKIAIRTARDERRRKIMLRSFFCFIRGCERGGKKIADNDSINILECSKDCSSVDE